jgi:hypothetical protein
MKRILMSALVTGLVLAGGAPAQEFLDIEVFFQHEKGVSVVPLVKILSHDFR